MTLEKLDNLLENDLIKNRKDKLIALKIIEAERDWPKSILKLGAFIENLEIKIDGKTSQENLKNYLNKNKTKTSNHSAWINESIHTLLEIFDLSGFGSLDKIFSDLSTRLNEITTFIKPIVFEKKGYPIIKIQADQFEIKAIDYWEFRRFSFSEIKEIKLVDIRKNGGSNYIYPFLL